MSKACDHLGFPSRFLPDLPLWQENEFDEAITANGDQEAALKGTREVVTICVVPLLLSSSKQHTLPFLWKCSGCGEQFSLEPIGKSLSFDELKEIDTRFREHCKQKHPGAPLLGLPQFH